ncbi:hypothetical protein [Novosphingobium sp. 9U]|nr:hypothetical protein [Novosphingobium sp. 9U]VWX54387.1 hypothetical protein NOVOSPHI9U_600002 [Novosphingobium sp. 9U]
MSVASKYVSAASHAGPPGCRQFHKRIGLLGANPDMFEALDDAEMDRASY